MNAFQASTFCSSTSDILGFIGWIVFIVKIAMPLLIIVYGILDFGKAVTGGDTKNIKDSFSKFGIRVIAGLIIFFIPTIVMWVFGLVAQYAAHANEFEICQKCILDPWACPHASTSGKSNTSKK